MDLDTHMALMIGLTHGAVILLGLRELWLLRRPGWRPDNDPPRVPVPGPVDDGGRPAPLPSKPLPDCLIPRRVRVLEDA
jgi:hypothetical protein